MADVDSAQEKADKQIFDNFDWAHPNFDLYGCNVCGSVAFGAVVGKLCNAHLSFSVILELILDLLDISLQAFAPFKLFELSIVLCRDLRASVLLGLLSRNAS